MSTHNKTYFTVKIGSILLLIALAFYLGTRASSFVKDVQASKARMETIADTN